MSLIHDALKSMDADAPQPSRLSPSARAPAAARRGRPAWLDGLLAFCVVVGAGVVGWYVWQGRAQPGPAPEPGAQAVASAGLQAAHAPASAPETGAAADIATGEPAAAPATVPDAVPDAVPDVGHVADPAVPAGATPPAAAPAARDTAAPAVPAPAPAARPQAAPRHHQARTVRHAAAPAALQPLSAPKADDTPVQVRFTRFVAAMRSGQTTDAERELTALKAVLPADSLGLMRAQAWFDLRAGNETAAAQTYRQILGRMPGDEEAAINLASIQVRQADQEGARATLDAAARLNPDSSALRAALAQYTPNVRK